MTVSAFILCAFAALFFASYQLVLRASGLPPMVAGFVMHLVGTVVFLPLFLRENLAKISFISLGIGLAVVAGVLQALGHVPWQKLIADRQIPMATSVVVMIVINIVITAIGGAVFFKEGLTASKVAGMVLASASIWLMVRD